MATISACTSTSSIARAALVHKASAVRPAAVLGKNLRTSRLFCYHLL